jgi:hypothetical protein
MKRSGFPNISLKIHRFNRRNLSALVMTETEDRLIAAAAIIGDKRSPVTG